jgi:hypothetical protein|tara:strand:- start:455 stop:898 length:444 start_codon:yes stop_codon:yes gene_type:complete
MANIGENKMVATRTKSDLMPMETYHFGAEPLIVNIDAIGDVQTSTTKVMGSALDGATRTIEQFGNIIARGPAINSNTEFNVMMEHSQSAGATGKGKASTRTTMQASLRALGTIDGVNFSTATATDSALKILVGDVLAPSALENPDLS